MAAILTFAVMACAKGGALSPCTTTADCASGDLCVRGMCVSSVGPGPQGRVSVVGIDPDHVLVGDAGPEDGTPPDTAEDVSGADAAPDADVGDSEAGPKSVATAIALTAGAGRVSSPGYRLDARIGAPQPMGLTRSAGHALRAGSVILP